MVLCEGPEGVKWELELACFCSGKTGFGSLGLRFIDWEWGKNAAMGMGQMSLSVSSQG